MNKRRKIQMALAGLLIIIAPANIYAEKTNNIKSVNTEALISQDNNKIGINDLTVKADEYDMGKFSGKITDSRDGSVYRARVEIYLNGEYYDNTYTDEYGNFDFKISDYDRSKYLEDGYYNGQRINSDYNGYYIYLENGQKRYIDFEIYYGKDYKVDILVSKNGYNSKKVNLVNQKGQEKRYENKVNENYNSKRVYPKNIYRTNYSVSGNLDNYPNASMYIFEGNNFLGREYTNDKGYFYFRFNKYVPTYKDLEYYIDLPVEREKEDSQAPYVTVAEGGTKFVKGVAGSNSRITVLDSEGYNLGSATTGNDLQFVVDLNRNLVTGEKIKIIAQENNRKEKSIEYTIKGKIEEVPTTNSVLRVQYINGYPDGTFKPSKPVTRAEAVSMFVNLVSKGNYDKENKTTPFVDSNDKWYSPKLNYAASKGFISGYSDNTFKPENNITRAEFATMISVFIKDGYTGKGDFKDIKGHWASDAVNELYGNKIISGYPDGTFKPDKELTRAEAVVILNSSFGRNTRPDSLINFNTSNLLEFRDVDKDHWAYYEILDASNAHRTQKTEKTEELNIWR